MNVTLWLGSDLGLCYNSQLLSIIPTIQVSGSTRMTPVSWVVMDTLKYLVSSVIMLSNITILTHIVLFSVSVSTNCTSVC